LCEDIPATGELDHLRYPVACDIERREPFDTGHAGAMSDSLDASPDSLESIVQLRGKMMALR
jgi:hypothetical protein